MRRNTDTAEFVLWVAWILWLAFCCLPLFLMGSCAYVKTVTLKEQSAIKAALEGWKQAGLPEPTHCKVFSPQAAVENPSEVLKHDELIVDDRGEPIIHEMMHVFYYCSGLPWWEPGNILHLDKQVWIAGGDDVGSAQARAEAIYRGLP